MVIILVVRTVSSLNYKGKTIVVENTDAANVLPPEIPNKKSHVR